MEKPHFDVLQKALSKNGEAVVYALNATQIVQESLERLDAWPPATKHLGQGMMAALLLQALADTESSETLSLQWMCEGPFGHLFAEARNFGEVRATIREPRPDVDNYETGLGTGLLQVRRARGKAATTSIVNSKGLVSEDIVEYLEQSEQKNCGVNFSVQIEWDSEDKNKFRVRSALAYMVHVLPQPTEQKLNEALLRWDRQMLALGSISHWLLRSEQSTQDMLRLLLGEEEPNIVMTQRVAFSCSCTVQRAARALAMVESQAEKEGEKIEKAPTEIRCEYCGKSYTIGAKVKKAGKKPAKKIRKKAPTAKKKLKKPAKKPAKPKKKPKKKAVRDAK